MDKETRRDLDRMKQVFDEAGKDLMNEMAEGLPDRITRLTNLAKKLWPDAAVRYRQEGENVRVWVQSGISAVDYVAFPPHPLALNGLEALLTAMQPGERATQASSLFASGRRFERAMANFNWEINEAMVRRAIDAYETWQSATSREQGRVSYLGMAAAIGVSFGLKPERVLLGLTEKGLDDGTRNRPISSRMDDD